MEIVYPCLGYIVFYMSLDPIFSLSPKSQQSHDVIKHYKQRYYPMRGFGSFASAARFLAAFDELRQYFRARSINQKTLPLSEQRCQFKRRFADLFITDPVT